MATVGWWHRLLGKGADRLGKRPASWASATWSAGSAPWVLNDDERAGRVGAPLDCLCDRAELPEGLEGVRTTDVFDVEPLGAARFSVESSAVRSNLRASFAGPVTAPIGIRTATGAWRAVLRSFVDQYRTPRL